MHGLWWLEPFKPSEKPAGVPVETVYTPDFPTHQRAATETGHGGGDFFTSHHFSEAIRTGQQPYLDVYRGIDMSIVGILAWRSALNDSAPVAVPDFRSENVRKTYENDHWSPDPTRESDNRPPTSILGDILPTEEAREYARGIWAEKGYHGE